MNKDKQRISMFTLGVPCIEVDGQVKTISRRQARALLNYLVCKRSSMTRER